MVMSVSKRKLGGKKLFQLNSFQLNFTTAPINLRNRNTTYMYTKTPLCFEHSWQNVRHNLTKSRLVYQLKLVNHCENYLKCININI